MSVINRIAFYQNRRDEVPNQELARDLAANRDQVGVNEIAHYLQDRNQGIQNDCLKVLYEVGYLEPALIMGFMDDFLALLMSKENRIVWGSMIALSTISVLQASAIYARREQIIQCMAKGSVITVDNGIKTLAQVASQSEEYRTTLFPYLIHHLQSCRAKEVPQHGEKILVAVSRDNKVSYIQTLESRLDGLTTSQAARVKKLIKQAVKL
jgi:hypothetical protein